jgi:hypothetical protein
MVSGIGFSPRSPDLDEPSGPALGTPAPPSPPVLGRNEWASGIDRAIDLVATEITSRMVAENLLTGAPKACSASGSNGVGSLQHPTPTPMQAKLDAFMASARGPYRAEGQTVEVPAFFRMNNGWNQSLANKPDHRAALASAAESAHIPPSTVAIVQSGRGSPEQVREVTQALIDAGQLEKSGPDLVTRIQRTMWKFGVGMDCADYAQRAFLAVHGGSRGDLGLKPDISNEDLQGLDRASKLVKVGVAHARPGDLFILGSPFQGEPGHCVIVYSHEVASEEAKAAMRQRCGADAYGLLKGDSVVHLYQVDSSWSAGSMGRPYGGVRRETWLYDETHGLWGRLELAAGGQFSSSTGPAGHPVVGAYRPRGMP